MKQSLKQLIAFLLVGLVVNLSSVAVFHFLTVVLSTNLYLSVVIVFLLATSTSYLLNARYSFSGTRKSGSSLKKYYFINVFVLCIQTVIVTIGTAFSIHATVAYFLALVASAGINFILVKKLVFLSYED